MTEVSFYEPSVSKENVDTETVRNGAKVLFLFCMLTTVSVSAEGPALFDVLDERQCLLTLLAWAK